MPVRAKSSATACWLAIVASGLVIVAGCGQPAAGVPAGDVRAVPTLPPPPPVLASTADEPPVVEAGPLNPAPPDPAPPDPAPAAADGLAADQTPEADAASPPPGAANGSDEAAPPPDDPVADGSAAADTPASGEAETPLRQANPFPRRLEIPEFPAGMTWLNSRPLTRADLKGKFVLLDFWTYCCINCMHILPELKKLERQFPKNLVVIGVHSAKFDAERDTNNIREAVLRYEIEHPVINDADHKIWDMYGISSWPTLLLIDPEGMAVWGKPGERKAEEIAAILNAALPYYRQQKLLDEEPLPLELEALKQPSTPLRFPGKILADEQSGRLFISDSNHNRIVVASLEGALIDVIGSGAIGRDDGPFESATFNKPQGCVLQGDRLYVADTENHLLRKVDLKARTVATIAGTGQQAPHAWPGLDAAQLAGKPPERWSGPPLTTALASPWALWIHGRDLYIAMAGAHQIWKMDLDENEIGPFAGNGREDIVDGMLLPRVPYMQGFSSFAQPSGLSSDGTYLYVADSEGSSIRGVPFDRKRHVKTVVGSNRLDSGRLFAFGDADGPRSSAKLQHCLEVVFLAGKLYVADTYNHKIKVVDARNGATRTLAGTGKPGTSDNPPQFHEPAGLAYANGKLFVADTNNHLLRTIDLATGQVATLAIAGLAAPQRNGEGANGGGNEQAAAPPPKKPSFAGAHEEKLPAATVQPVSGTLTLAVSLKPPPGWKLNPLAPMSYWLDSPRATGPVDRSTFGRTKLDEPSFEFEIPLPVSGAGEDELQLSLGYYYCQDKDDGVCKVGAVVFTVPLKIAAGGGISPVKLNHAIPE